MPSIICCHGLRPSSPLLANGRPLLGSSPQRPAGEKSRISSEYACSSDYRYRSKFSEDSNALNAIPVDSPVLAHQRGASDPTSATDKVTVNGVHAQVRARGLSRFSSVKSSLQKSLSRTFPSSKMQAVPEMVRPATNPEAFARKWGDFPPVEVSNIIPPTGCSRLSTMKNGLRKRFSRHSSISGRSGLTQSRNDSINIEDINQEVQELKRVMHAQLNSDLTTPSTSQGFEINEPSYLMTPTGDVYRKPSMTNPTSMLVHPTTTLGPETAVSDINVSTYAEDANRHPPLSCVLPNFTKEPNKVGEAWKKFSRESSVTSSSGSYSLRKEPKDMSLEEIDQSLYEVKRQLRDHLEGSFSSTSTSGRHNEDTQLLHPSMATKLADSTYDSDAKIIDTLPMINSSRDVSERRVGDPSVMHLQDMQISKRLASSQTDLRTSIPRSSSEIHFGSNGSSSAFHFLPASTAPPVPAVPGHYGSFFERAAMSGTIPKPFAVNDGNSSCYDSRSSSSASSKYGPSGPRYRTTSPFPSMTFPGSRSRSDVGTTESLSFYTSNNIGDSEAPSTASSSALNPWAVLRLQTPEEDWPKARPQPMTRVTSPAAAMSQPSGLEGPTPAPHRDPVHRASNPHSFCIPRRAVSESAVGDVGLMSASGHRKHSSSGIESIPEEPTQDEPTVKDAVDKPEYVNGSWSSRTKRSGFGYAFADALADRPNHAQHNRRAQHERRVHSDSAVPYEDGRWCLATGYEGSKDGFEGRQENFKKAATSSAVSHSEISRTFRVPGAFDGAQEDDIEPRDKGRPETASNESNATELWEKALRNHAEMQARGYRGRLPSEARPSTVAQRVTRKSLVPKAAPRKKHRSADMRMPMEECVSAWEVELGVSKARRKPSDSLTAARIAVEESLKSGKEGAWVRFPSQRRKETTSSAGPADDVIPRDFATGAVAVEGGITGDDGVGGGSVKPGGREKNMKEALKNGSVRMGKDVAQGFGRSWRTESTAYRLQNTGHRSSVATGGRLEYPELELVTGTVGIFSPRVSQICY